MLFTRICVCANICDLKTQCVSFKGGTIMNITFQEAYESYIKYITIKKKAQSLRSIRSRFENYILPYFQHLKLSELTPALYLDWQYMIEKKNFKFSYKKSLHFSNVALLNYCMKFFDLNRNVASLVGCFSNNHEPKNVDFFTLKEFKKFIRKVEEREYKTFFEFLYWTGVREGEALALTWNDISKSRVHITKTISKECVNNERIITSPKTRSSIRTIKIDLILRFKLHLLKRMYKKLYSNFDDNCFVFGCKKAFSQSTVERKKNKACKLARVKQIRVHDFRHSYATLLLSHRVRVEKVAQNLGHSDIATTLNTYSHVLQSEDKQISSLLFCLHLM